MKRWLCVACLVMSLPLLACEEPKPEPSEPSASAKKSSKVSEKKSKKEAKDSEETKKDKKSSPSSSAKDGTSAKDSTSAKAGAQGVAPKALDGALVDEVKLPFGHHVLLDKTTVIGSTTQRTLALEVVGVPLGKALKDLEDKLLAAGFKKTDDQEVGGSSIRGYGKGSMFEPGGRSVRLQGSAYGAEGGAGVARGSTSQLSVTVRMLN